MKNLKSNIRGQENKVSRRVFIGVSDSAAASFTIVPHHVFRGPGNIPPSQKLNIAGIGAGGREDRHL